MEENTSETTTVDTIETQTEITIPKKYEVWVQTFAERGDTTNEYLSLMENVRKVTKEIKQKDRIQFLRKLNDHVRLQKARYDLLAEVKLQIKHLKRLQRQARIPANGRQQ